MCFLREQGRSSCGQDRHSRRTPQSRVTLYDMKTRTVTIRIDAALACRLDRAALRSGRSRSAVVRDALERQLAPDQLADLRRRIVPFAKARGYLTDGDIFRDID